MKQFETTTISLMTRQGRPSLVYGTCAYMIGEAGHPTPWGLCPFVHSLWWCPPDVLKGSCQITKWNLIQSSLKHLGHNLWYFVVWCRLRTTSVSKEGWKSLPQSSHLLNLIQSSFFYTLSVPDSRHILLSRGSKTLLLFLHTRTVLISDSSHTIYL